MLKQKISIMKLEVFISKKGTKVVRTTNLHAALELSNDLYIKNVRKWLKDVYEFRDGIRSPEPMEDFAKKPSDNPVVEDYYITVELAKLIALASTSKVKRKFAAQLRSLEEEQNPEEAPVSPHQIRELISLAQKMKKISFQEESERNHLEQYKSEHGSIANWWNYRENILGYSSSFWKEGALSNKELAKGLSQRELIINADQHEAIRAGVVDYYMAMGKEESEARKLGNLAKIFADELGLEILDDRGEAKQTASTKPEALVREINPQDQKQQVLWAS